MIDKRSAVRAGNATDATGAGDWRAEGEDRAAATIAKRPAPVQGAGMGKQGGYFPSVR